MVTVNSDCCSQSLSVGRLERVLYKPLCNLVQLRLADLHSSLLEPYTLPTRALVVLALGHLPHLHFRHLDFIDAQVGAGEETSAILKSVRLEFGQQIRAIGSGESFVTDNQIKNRCNYLKSSKKSKVDV